MQEEKLYLKLFPTMNIKGLCDDYDVAWGDDGEPFIFYDALWWPICSMFFNDNTARLFCRQLEYDDGTFEVIETGHDYDLDIVSKNKMVPMKSFLVGNCTETDSTLRSCSGGCNPRIWRRDGNCGEEGCDAGNSVRIKVHCTMPPKTTTTVTVETTTNNTNMTTIKREATSDTSFLFRAKPWSENEISTKISATEDQFETKKPSNATTNSDVGESTNINGKVNSTETNMTTVKEETTSDTIKIVARNIHENENSIKIPATEGQFEIEKPGTATSNADVGDSTNINAKFDSSETDAYEYKDDEGATDIDENVTLDKGYDDRIDYDPDENNTTNASDTIDTNGTLNGYPNSKIPSNVKSQGILEGLNMDYIDNMDDAEEANMNEPGVGVTVDGEPIGKRSSCKGTSCSSNMKLL